jgi:hypothetical protein
MTTPTPPPTPHDCPVCHRPQTKIRRRLNGEAFGSIVYVCARPQECVVGFDLAKVETWVAV